MFNSFLSKKIKYSSSAGFTLIELMVASALFVTAVSIAIEALFAIEHSYARVDGLRIVMDNLNNSFDLISRDVRYGSVYFCGNDIEDVNRTYRQGCPFKWSTYPGVSTEGGTAIMFKPSGAVAANVRKGYYLSGGKVYEYILNTLGATSTLPITGDDVYIDTLRFFVEGANTSQTVMTNDSTLNAPGATADNYQPVITVVIAGRSIVSTSKVGDSHFQLQTTITARHLDI